MRFIGTERFSPVAKKLDLPWDEDYFHLSPESINPDSIADSVTDDNWWYIQRDRCINGFVVEDAIEPGGDAIVDGVDAIWKGDDVYLTDYDLWIKNRALHITGRHYFYLNFWPIYGLDHKTEVKTMIPPRFLDMDYLFYLRIMNMVRFKKDGQELKGRQLGFSEKGAGGVIGFNYTFFPGSLNIIVGGIEDDALKTMRDATRGLDNLVNTQFYKQRAKGGDSQTYLKAKNTQSQIYCLTAKDNPQTASRFSPFWVWMEEIGKGKKEWSIKTAGYIKPSIEAENIKTGFINYIGTAGEMDEGTYDLEKRHYDPKASGILSFTNKFDEVPNKNLVGHFTSKAWFYKTDSDGNSLMQDSIKLIQDERASLNAKDRYLHTTQYPIYASEAFYTSGGGFFGEDIVQRLNEKIAYLNNHKELNPEKRGFLKWKDPENKWKGVTFEANPEGPIYIYEHPYEVIIGAGPEGIVPYNLYFTGTDSYDQDEAFHSDSLGSCRVWKRFWNADTTYKKWVAKVLQRPTEAEGGAERFFENTALLTMYYNSRNLIEHSKIRIIDWYQTQRLGGLLKERPDIVISSFIQNSKATNRYGIDPSTKKEWLNLLRDKLTPEQIERMDDIDQMRRFAKFRYDPTGKKYNCDETIASSLSIIHEYDEREIAPTTGLEKKPETLEQRFGGFRKDKYGNIVNTLN